MAKMMKYHVVREHYGDKSYVEGDERIAAPSDVAHLIPHVLEPIGEIQDEAEEVPAKQPAAKAETVLQNKAEKPHSDKADHRRKPKGK